MSTQLSKIYKTSYKWWKMYAERLREIRTKLKLTIDEMAEKLEIKARTIGGYERGERTPSIELGTQLCNKLNVNLNWFCTGEGNMFNPIQRDKDELKELFKDIIENEFKKRGL